MLFPHEDESLVDQVHRSIAASDHLSEADAASINLALKFAAAIDKGHQEGSDKLTYGPASSLEKILGNLGLTPAGRHSLGLDLEEEVEEPDDF